MKKNMSKTALMPIIIIAHLFIIGMIPVSLSSCHIQNRKVYTTYTGKYVTIWNDYIIFEKYEGRKHPKDNYIKLSHKDVTDVFFKNNDSILIYRRGDENSIDVVFSQYNVEVFYNTWDEMQEFKRRTSYKDATVNAEYFFYGDRSVLWPTFNECIGDSMYIREYPVDRKHSWFFMMDLYDYNDSVFSRYDERFDNRVF